MAIFEFGGGVDGVADYLVNGKKQGREQHRDEIDKRVILEGDLSITDKIINSMQTEGEKYDHITLSFKEEDMSEEMLKAISDDFKAFAFGAYQPDEINFYAEAHIPKTKTEEKWNPDTKKVETLNRHTHIHFVISKLNLVTGERASCFEYLLGKYAGKDQTADFIDAFQEHINAKYGLASPKDNRRDNFTTNADILSRIKGDDFTGRNRESLKLIRDAMIEKGIESPEAFKVMLAVMGTVSVGHGQGGDYLQVKLYGQTQNVRLKDHQFTDEFVSLPMSEKLAFYDKKLSQVSENDKATTAAKREELLSKWHDRAREIKYLSPSSKFFKEQYSKATDKEKRFALDKLEEAHYNKLNKEQGYERSDGSERHTALQNERQNARGLAGHDGGRAGRVDVSAVIDRNLTESSRNIAALTTHSIADANAIRECAGGLAANALAAQLASILRGGRSGIDNNGIAGIESGGLNGNRREKNELSVERNLSATDENNRLFDGLGELFWNAALANRASIDSDVAAHRYEAFSNGKLNSVYLRTTDELRAADKAGQQIIDEPESVIKALTFSQSAFNEAALERYLLKNTADAAQYDEALKAVLACPELVVHHDADKGIQFSSREIVAIEKSLVARAGRMAATNLKAVPDSSIESIIKSKTFNVGQRDSFRLLCSGKQACVVNGAAGTGKSYILSSAREAWEVQGYKVYGAILQGKTAEDLERDSGIQSRTIAKMLLDLKKDRLKLDSKCVIVVDEAGMVGSRDMEKLLSYVEAAGARIRLVGDAKQLAAVEYGNAFVEVSARCEVGSLTEIMRQKVDWMREASERFSAHDISALRAYHEHSHIHIADTTMDAMILLVEKWNAHRTKHADQSRIVLAHTNAERIALNDMMRAEIKKQGGLQDDTDVVTKRGIVKMAVGERVMFTAGDREMGVKNGTTGTISKIGKDGTITVMLENNTTVKFNADGRGTKEGNEVDYSYAVTVHKSQGMTLDKAFVLANSSMTLENLYVAMTRHKYDVELVASAEQFADIDSMLKGLDRAGQKAFTDGNEWTSTKRPEDSRIGQYLADLNAEKVIENAAHQARYKEIAANLEAKRVLDYLSKTHGIDVSKYEIVTEKGGKQRIQTSDASLDVANFLTKKMHLDYKTEAEPILKQCYAEQLANIYSTPRYEAGQGIDQQLKAEFTGHLKERAYFYQAEKDKLDDKKRTAKAGIVRLPPAEQKLALAELSNRIKTGKAALKAEFDKPTPAVYKDFLAERAPASKLYLQEFRRVAVTPEDKGRLAEIEVVRAAELEQVRSRVDKSLAEATLRAQKAEAVAIAAHRAEEAAQAAVIKAQKIVEAEKAAAIGIASPAGQLADIYKIIADHQQGNIKDRNKLVLLADKENNTVIYGTSIGSNDTYLAGRDGKNITIHRIADLLEIVYDGIATDGDRFAPGNSFEIQYRNDGTVTAKVIEKRKELQIADNQIEHGRVFFD